VPGHGANYFHDHNSCMGLKYCIPENSTNCFFMTTSGRTARSRAFKTVVVDLKKGGPVEISIGYRPFARWRSSS
jgi:hypothetical protein